MSALTDFAENLALSWLFTADTVTRPTGWVVSLHTDDPGESGAANELQVSTDADYVRKSVTFGTPSSGQTLSTTAVTWTAAADTAGYTITHAAVWDGAGNCLIKGPLAKARTMAAGDVLTFEIGEIVATAD